MPENKEVRKLELCDIAPYLQYDLIVHSRYNNRRERVIGLSRDQAACVHAESSNPVVWDWKYEDIKPYVRPLYQLMQEITHNGEKLVFTELFEIGDDGGYNYEFDFGNVKLIKQLKKIAEHNIIADIPYLPHQVIKEMLKYHFDISGLCDSGLAIPIHNTK